MTCPLSPVTCPLSPPYLLIDQTTKHLEDSREAMDLVQNHESVFKGEKVQLRIG